MSGNVVCANSKLMRPDTAAGLVVKLPENFSKALATYALSDASLSPTLR